MSKDNKIEDLHGDHFAQARTILVALGSDEEWAIFRHSGSKDIKITGARFIPDTAITGHATANLLLQVQNRGVGGAETVAVSDAFEYDIGVDGVAFQANEFVLSTTAANLIVSAGEVLALLKTETGAGLELPPGLVEISYEYN